MNLLIFATLFVLCSAIQAITFSTLASVSVALLGLNKPTHGFFGGLFRRRKSPVKETIIPTEPPNPFGFPGQNPFMNQFGGFGGGGNMLFPGMNAPQFAMFGQNRFPPQPPVKQQQNRFPPQQTFPPHQQKVPPQQPPMLPPQPPMQLPLQQPPPFTTQQPNSIDDDSDGEEFSEGDSDVPGMNTEEAESFFTLLAETDENKCISRLVCEMGSNPDSGGEFGKTIVDIIGSLTDFPHGSKVSEYNEVLNIGMTEGLSSCLSNFSMCDDESFDMVKNSGVGGEEEGE